MDNLREKFKNFLDENIKKKDDIAVATTRLILAAIKDHDIQFRTKKKGDHISDEEILNLNRENSGKTNLSFWACSLYYNPIDVIKIFSYRAFAMIPPPKHSLFLYNTADCPGAIALIFSENSIFTQSLRK